MQVLVAWHVNGEIIVCFNVNLSKLGMYVVKYWVILCEFIKTNYFYMYSEI